MRFKTQKLWRPLETKVSTKQPLLINHRLAVCVCVVLHEMPFETTGLHAVTCSVQIAKESVGGSCAAKVAGWRWQRSKLLPFVVAVKRKELNRN